MPKDSLEESLRKFHLRYTKGESSADCWMWIGAINSRGYGTCKVDGKTVTAHRFSYQIFRGEPGSLFVCHSCDVRACVNPDHLWLGTNADNLHDMANKGRNRQPSGEVHWRAKLDTDSVEKIRNLISCGVPQRKIAVMFGVHRGAISNIALNKTWSIRNVRQPETHS